MAPLCCCLDRMVIGTYMHESQYAGIELKIESIPITGKVFLMEYVGIFFSGSKVKKIQTFSRLFSVFHTLYEPYLSTSNFSLHNSNKIV